MGGGKDKKRKRKQGLTIDLPAVADPKDSHYLFLEVDGVEDPVLTLVHPKAFASGHFWITISPELLAVVWAGVLRELEDAECYLPKDFGLQAG